MDEDYEDKRRAIQANAKNPTGHVLAGVQVWNENLYSL